MATLKSTTAEIQQALSFFWQPGHVYELRALGTSKGTQSGYFDAVDKMAEAASKLSGHCTGIYFTPNPVTPDLLARASNRVREFVKLGESTKDDEITQRCTLLVDFDAARPAGISSTDEEHELALSRARQCMGWLSGQGWPDAMLADSGNGGHLIYRISLSNNVESRQLLEKCLKALAYQFNDEAVTVDPTNYNASRIWKVYGTLVRKGDPLPDRPHRVATILEDPDQLKPVRTELLQQLAAMAPETKRSEPRSGNSNNLPPIAGKGDYATLDVVAWSQLRGHYGRALGNGKHAIRCPWEHEHTDQRGAEDSDTVVWEAIEGQWPTFHCSHAHCIGRTIKDVMKLWGDADTFCSQEFRPQKTSTNINHHVPKTDEGTEKSPPQKSQATRLVEMANDVEFWHSPEFEAFATIKVDTHYENWSIKSQGFRRWLSRRFYERAGATPNAQALQDASTSWAGKLYSEGLSM